MIGMSNVRDPLPAAAALSSRILPVLCSGLYRTGAHRYRAAWSTAALAGGWSKGTAVQVQAAGIPADWGERSLLPEVPLERDLSHAASGETSEPKGVSDGCTGSVQSGEIPVVSTVADAVRRLLNRLLHSSVEIRGIARCQSFSARCPVTERGAGA